MIIYVKMARVCIPIKYRDKFIEALDSGKIDVDELWDMTSNERRNFFKKYVGDAAKVVNQSYEAALKSERNTALLSWVERMKGEVPEPIRKDLLKRVRRNEKYMEPDEFSGFLDDLVEEKLGFRVTEKQANDITKLSDDIAKKESKITESMDDFAIERLEYGLALKQFRNYTNNIINKTRKLAIKERVSPTMMMKNLEDFSGFTKSLKASFDISFTLRQGIKALLVGAPEAVLSRGKNTQTLKAFENMVKVAADAWGNGRFFLNKLKKESPETYKFVKEAMDNKTLTYKDLVEAQILGRKNSLNGKYRAAKNGYGLNITHEEAFPTSAPEKLPVVGKIFEKSESSFGTAAMRLRADLADAMIETAEKNGVDMLDEVHATSKGIIVASMTGRGDIGKLAANADKINALVFSVRFLKSNIDTLTASITNKNVTKADKKIAGKNLLKIIGSVGTLLTAYELMVPGDAAGIDPRNRKTFGKIKVGDRWIDVTGGLGGLAAFAIQFVPTVHEGEVGWWRYSENTKKWTRSNSGNFGEATLLDSLESFFEGKVSPPIGVIRDLLEWKTFSGDTPNFVNTATGLFFPISVEQVYSDLKDGRSDTFIAAFAEGVGLTPTDAIPGGYQKKWKELKTQIDSTTYNKALKEYWVEFNKQFDEIKNEDWFLEMTLEERNKEIDSLREDVAQDVIFKYEP